MRQAVWSALKDDLLTVKKNAGSVYNSLWQHYAIIQIEQDVRSKLTAITEASGALQEHRKVAQAITDFVHFANIVRERKKRHEFTRGEDKEENDKDARGPEAKDSERTAAHRAPQQPADRASREAGNATMAGSLAKLRSVATAGADVCFEHHTAGFQPNGKEGAC